MKNVNPRPGTPDHSTARQFLETSNVITEFCSRWEASTPDDAMSRAMADLRTRGHQPTPPVGLTSLLKLLGVKTRQTEMRSRGTLHATPGGWVVEINKTLNWRSARFSIAHELAHVLLYNAVADQPTLLRELQQPDLWWPIEGLCDRAAAELLIPAKDITARMKSRSTTTLNAFFDLHDTYMVSVVALLRRMQEVGDDHSLTTWDHRPHNASGPDWRINDAYISDKKIRLPRHLSKRHISPDLISIAAEHGFAHEPHTSITVGGRRYSGEGTAFRPRGRTQDALPLYEGHAVPDETSSLVYLLMRHTSTGPISRRTKFG